MNTLFKCVCVGVAVSAACSSSVIRADLLVFEPSISLDQRFDDNYYLSTNDPGSLSATRIVGDIALSDETQSSVFRIRARADALLTTQYDGGEEGTDYNGLLGMELRFSSNRARYGIVGNLTLDTPSRDIAADISDANTFAADTSGVDLTQSLTRNVARREAVIKPQFEYDISRRLAFTSGATYTNVEHEEPDTQDVLYQWYLATTDDAELKAYGDVTAADTGVFSPNPESELDNYDQWDANLGFRYKLTPISTASLSFAYSRLASDVELNINDPEFEQGLVAQGLTVEEARQLRESLYVNDPNEPSIRRFPRIEETSSTSKLRAGYERFLMPNLRLASSAGAYLNVADDDTEAEGWLADIGLDYDTGKTRYAGKLAIDVLPSSAGAPVETMTLIGQLQHTVNADLRFLFNARAYEPDKLGTAEAEQSSFGHRFISFEPKLEWQFTRNWTWISAYRYRRQKEIADPASAESHAVLLALRYSPPSELRDRARQRGL